MAWRSDEAVAIVVTRTDLDYDQHDDRRRAHRRKGRGFENHSDKVDKESGRANRLKRQDLTGSELHASDAAVREGMTKTTTKLLSDGDLAGARGREAGRGGVRRLRRQAANGDTPRRQRA